MINELPFLSHKLRNELRALHSASVRDERKRFLAEGPHLCDELLSSGAATHTVVVYSDAPESVWSIARRFRDMGVHVVQCSAKSLELLSTVKTPQDIIAEASFLPARTVAGKVLLLDDVSDPGNVGTIIRSAAWFGFDSVALSPGCADVYNSKVLRASAGAVFKLNVLRKCNLHHWLLQHPEYVAVGTTPRGGTEPRHVATLQPLALVIGSEAHGMSNELIAMCKTMVSIPGGAFTESLNAAVAASILCYECREQRQ